MSCEHALGSIDQLWRTSPSQRTPELRHARKLIERAKAKLEKELQRDPWPSLWGSEIDAD